ncbi:MAG TPA: S-methyl-5'-thioadenosine phosphorylase [Acidimicrobiales bacterium]
MDEVADLGVFGGSGFTRFLPDATTVELTTPYGPTSAPVTVATVGARRVAFIPRHGLHHEHAPHAIPARANVWAMRALGVRSLLAPCAVGSLQPNIHPGDLVVVDQLVDRTWGRADTFHDDFANGGPQHVAFADPYDPVLRDVLLSTADALGFAVHRAGTMVVIQGPRFSTRAESAWFRAQGWAVVNMTGYPEAALAAEAGIPYAAIGLVTDYDAGVDGHEPVTQDQVFAFFERNLARVRELLVAAVPRLP